MKNAFLTLIFVLISTFTFANNTTSTNPFKGEITIVEQNQKDDFKFSLIFDDAKSFNNFDINQLDNIMGEECTASISVTVTVSVGVVSASATVTASGVPCDKIKEKVKELKAQALAGLK